MKFTFLIIFALLERISFAQNTKSLERCSLQFQQTLASSTPSTAEENFTKGWEYFRKCVFSLPFPDFRATTTDGKIYSLNQLRGKVILINTWFIGCHPCEAELPSFNELSKEFTKNEFVILSFGRDDAESILEFNKKHSMSFPVFANSEELITKKFKIPSGYPTNILLDKQGKIVLYNTGGPIEEPGIQKTKEELRAKIKELLKIK